MRCLTKLFLVLAVIFFPLASHAQITAATNIDSVVSKVNFVLFHSETCPHCRAEIAFVNTFLKPRYQAQVNFEFHEVGDKQSARLFFEYIDRYQANAQGVPVTFVDDAVIYGFRNNETTGDDLINAIEKAIKKRSKTTVVTPVEQELSVTTTANKINMPFFGAINPRALSLPVLTVVLGLLDGFNPCAMWVLLFLITLLLGIENRRRMWLLGSLFILTSGAVYFFFMAAWLNFILFVGAIALVRIGIGAVAVMMGGKNLYDYWKNRHAAGVVCAVSNKEETKKTFTKIKEIVYRRSIGWSIIGILILGFSVNLVELACSAGFPAIYTQILSLSKLALWQKYFYMFGYIVFYMLDDLVVFLVAMFTLKQKVFGTKYAKYTNLIAGALILILGLLLIFKPAWIMFS